MTTQEEEELPADDESTLQGSVGSSGQDTVLPSTSTHNLRPRSVRAHNIARLAAEAAGIEPPLSLSLTATMSGRQPRRGGRSGGRNNKP